MTSKELKQKINDTKLRLDQQKQETEALFEQSNKELSEIKQSHYQAVEELLEALERTDDRFHSNFNNLLK